jgi:hypothetical protein
MIIVHASLYKGQLLLWGERPQNQTVVQTTRSARRQRVAKPGPYPYDAGIDSLTRSVKDAGIDLDLTADQVEESVVWLPTKGAVPVPSSPLIAEPPTSRLKTKLEPWIVTT